MGQVRPPSISLDTEARRCDAGTAVSGTPGESAARTGSPGHLDATLEALILDPYVILEDLSIGAYPARYIIDGMGSKPQDQPLEQHGLSWPAMPGL